MIRDVILRMLLAERCRVAVAALIEGWYRSVPDASSSSSGGGGSSSSSSSSKEKGNHCIKKFLHADEGGKTRIR